MNERSTTGEWIDVIEHLSPTEFRDIASIFLRHHYQRSVELVDGTGDGGVDAWIVLDPIRRVRLAAQFHAGQGVAWETKLARDLQKVLRAHPGTNALVYVCGQKPAGENVTEVTTTIYAEHNVTVTLFDARSIASKTLEPDIRHDFLRTLSTRTGLRPAANPVQATILAHAFFDDGIASFRSTIVRSAILVQLIDEDLPRSELYRRMETVVGHAAERFVRRGIDALIKEHKLIEGPDTLLQCDPQVRADTRSILALQERRREKLVEDCARALESSTHGPDRRHDLANTLVDCLGTLWLEEARRRGSGPNSTQRGIDTEIRKQLAAIETQIHAYTKPGADSRAAFDQIMRVAAASPYARSLAAGELYRSWTALDRTDLAFALGRRAAIAVLLDTSVAMPLLCARFHRVAAGYYPSETAAALFDVARSRELRLIVPDVYIEEIAAHWMKSWSYAELTGSDPVLARSENFFVAQFHSVHPDSTRERFEEFLEGFSHRLVAAMDPNAFLRERARAERTFRLLLEECGVEVRDCPKSIKDARNVEGPIGRDQRVTEHDRRVIAWMQDPKDFDKSTELVLCTWDLWFREGNSTREWLAIDPSTLTDLIELLRPTDDRRPLVNVPTIAAAIRDEAAQQAAEIYDCIVQFHRKMPFPIDYRKAAIAFKTEWLSRRQPDPPSEADWQSFLVAGHY
jgi:hypothetical protein